MTKSIVMRNDPNLSVIVDDEDYDLVSSMKWYASYKKGKRWYACSSPKMNVHILLHRFIMNPPKNMQIDHINGDATDNRRCNLRIVTCRQNCSNKRIQSNNKSGYKGVYYDSTCKSSKKWKAQISYSGLIGKLSIKHLGRFDNPEDAAKEYDKAAKTIFGEYASLNFRGG